MFVNRSLLVIIALSISVSYIRLNLLVYLLMILEILQKQIGMPLLYF